MILPMPLLPSLLRLATIAAWGTSGPPLRPRAERNRVLRGLSVGHGVTVAVARQLPVAHNRQQTTTTVTVTVFTTRYSLHDYAAPLKPPQRIDCKQNSSRKLLIVSECVFSTSKALKRPDDNEVIISYVERATVYATKTQ